MHTPECSESIFIDIIVNQTLALCHYFCFHLITFKKLRLRQSQLLCSDEIGVCQTNALINMTGLILYFVVCRYRKVTGDTCQGGMEDQFAADMASCPIHCK